MAEPLLHTPGRRLPVLSLAVTAMIASTPLARAGSVAPVVPDLARPLPKSAVRLTGGPLKHAQDLNRAYLLELEPDRMLAWFRVRAGLEKKAEPYGGWDGGGKSLAGHILGHYLSAISMMGAATGEPVFRERAAYILAELKVVQDTHGDGYLGALEGGKERFAEVAAGNIRSAGFDLNGLWAPFYVHHKMFAGLRDCHRLLGLDGALALETGFASWTEGVLSKLDHAQMQKVLHTEFGGMNEVLADLYQDTGDPRWLALSRRFEHEAVMVPLQRHQDCLPGLHGNTQVPKVLGSLSRFALTGDAGDGFAAGFFWSRVAGHHSYATGGHGKDEYFGPPDTFSDRVDGRTAETCNVYNMLKLTRRLFALRPDAHYAEFHERALFNHILASIDPADGRTCYMVPVGRGVQREYQDMFGSFTCCVGSGMESHALHGDGIYYESGDTFWINLFAPSTARWEQAGATFTMETGFPAGESATVSLALATPRAFTLAIRRPLWAGEGFRVEVNGENLAELPAPGRHVEIRREWKDGDKVRLTLPMSLRLEPLPDNPSRAAILHGPIVLAGDLGPEDGFESWKPGAVPVFVAAGRPVSEWLQPISERPGWFRTVGVGRDKEVEFAPFYQLHRRTYAIYWDIFSADQWTARQEEFARQREEARLLAEATVGFTQPGEMQPERDANQQGEKTNADRVHGRPCRRGSDWFSFDLPVDPAHPMAVLATYHSDEWRKRTFDILVDGTRVGSQVVEKGGPPRFFDVEYPVPASVVEAAAAAGKPKVTVRFQATNGNEIAAVFGVRMVRRPGNQSNPASLNEK